MDIFGFCFHVLALSLLLGLPANAFCRSRSQSRIFVIERYDEIAKINIPDDEPVSSVKDKAHSVGKLKFGDFIWSTCSGPDALAKINQLEVSEPLSIPGNTTVTLDSNVFADITSPLKVSVKVQRKVGFLWIEVPCVDNVGSCNYVDLCAAIPFPPGQPCPEPFPTLGIPCHCPLPKGDYVIKDRYIQIPDEHVPEFLARGQYSVRAQASIGEQEVICFKCTFSLA